ncbi:hypothetical protein M501DRAFT_1014442 [Patellaria atrata CBS 101060]|uniref:Uncharacterized protein n=1 Tax=Patellaria atrata CBS 101060 TaxID=1346257 RepID=A0A9P4SFN8_9PEZI|nr:hypothetical protein M501DRAFT_1014442 [Patellaria atrata CBS 101060]
MDPRRYFPSSERAAPVPATPKRRGLVPWDDNKTILAFLSMQDAYQRQGIALPWDEAAKIFGSRLHKGRP